MVLSIEERVKNFGDFETVAGKIKNRLSGRHPRRFTVRAPSCAAGFTKNKSGLKNSDRWKR
jgi:hypothetical protein